MEFPHQGSGHEEQRKVCDDIAIAMDIVDIVCLDWALSRGVQLYTQDPTCFDRLAREDTEQKGDSRPDNKDRAEDPR